MRASTTLSLLALLGSTLAAPAPHHRKGKVVYETVVKTVYYTPGVSQPTPAPQPEQPKPEQPKPEEPKPTSVIVQPTEPEKPKETEAPKEESETPSTSTGYMAVVDEWRQKLGLAKLAHDDKLEANALNCVTESNGVMKHKLNPGSFGQVLAPGTPDKFEHVFVGGWLCEIPTLPGLDGVCATQSEGWAYNGQTGHAEILTDTKYTKIGCACVKDIWGCDLGY